jgi:hypothetical protein
MRTAPTVHLLAACLSLAALTPRLAHSEDATAAPYSPVPTSGTRTLNGHTFMPAADVPWPFTITNLVSDLTLGYGKTTATVTVRNQTFSGTMEYAAIGGVLAYEYAFWDHFSVRGSLNDTVFSGINGKSALAVGTEIQLGFGVGATASIPLGDTAQVGVLLDFATTPNLALTVLTGLQAIADSCNQPSGCHVETGQILGTTTTKTFQPAVAASWAPLRPLGLTGNVAYQHILSSGATDKSGNAISLAAAADWDFLGHSTVPVGLQLQFSYSIPFNQTGLQHVTDLGGGIFYTGRKDAAVGLQLLSRRFAVAPNVNVSWSTYIAAVGIRYFW